ncbi:hypothetical protein BCR36DRAFT_447088 [Piromyces finnis]|uniref:Uncharacterized protein n=1 Tax=Piromyces finnis TaxID=1754191 RepID=A0A1Y1VAH6_9FUNG|nr:hypothetical protein BCR36DRAFT_447088 [Piromyces finnis]|eukprot:ORX51119.1 hypothetical protein BCR36DRAFT_447088 [Piromyces finnis]
MKSLALETYYKNVIDEVANKTIETFNNNYNLNIQKEDVTENLVDEGQPPINKMKKLSINDTCIAVKRNKSSCKNKCIPGHVYCGTHLRYEGNSSLLEYVKMVANKYKYEIMVQNKLQNRNNHKVNIKWPLEIKNNSSSVNSYILFFTEFSSYFEAEVLIVHYISADKKDSYYMAIHYVEVNKCGEENQITMYIKVSLKSIDSLKIKPIYNKVISFLSEYGIPYDVNDINKRINDVTENNPVVMYNKINNIINNHYDVMYFSYDAYINSNINN